MKSYTKFGCIIQQNVKAIVQNKHVYDRADMFFCLVRGYSAYNASTI